MYNGIFDPALTGVLSVPTKTGLDPATAGVLSMGLGLLSTNGGPRSAGSLGNALGSAGMQGLQSYALADQQRRENQRADALVALERAKTMSTLQQAALAKAADERQRNFWQKLEAAMRAQGQGAPQPQPSAQYVNGQFVSAPTPPPQATPDASGNRFGITPPMVLAGMPAGINLLEAFKAGEPQTKIENGFIIQNGRIVGTVPQTNQQGFSTQNVPDAQGGYRVQVTPGAIEAYGTQQRIGEEARARLDPYKLDATAQEPARVTSRFNVLNPQGAAPSPMAAPPSAGGGARAEPRFVPNTEGQLRTLNNELMQEQAKAANLNGTAEERAQAQSNVAAIQREIANLRGGARQPAAPAGVPSGMSKEEEARQAARAEQMKHTAKAFAEQFTSMQNARMQNPAKIANIGRIDKLLENFEGGKLSGFGFELARLGNSLNLKIDDKLPAKEQAEALSKELALQLRQTGEGSGMPGALSDSDREFLRQMTPQMGQSAAGRKGMVEAKVALLQREMKVADMALQYRAKHGALDDSFFIQLNQWVDATPLFKK